MPMDQDTSKKDYLLPASILIAAVLISGSIVYVVGGKNSAGREGLANLDAALGTDAHLAISERDVILGNPGAPVTFIEYGDYQCPFCGRFFAETEGQIRENYIKTGKVKMVYRNFAFLGPESFAAAEAAECAKDQKQFWAFHDLLYGEEYKDGEEHNGNLNRDLFVKLAANLKLDTKAFAECVDNKKYASQIQNDSSDAQAAGVNSTPTIFVNDERIQGALPYASFKAVIDNFLNGR